MARHRHREHRKPGRLLRIKRLLLSAFALALLAGAVFVFHSHQMRRQATALRELGRKAVAENDPALAAEFYKQYLAARPHDIEVQSELAGVYAELAKSKPAFALEAIAILEEKVLSFAPERHTDRRKLAELYFQIGKNAAARKNWDELLATGDPALTGDPEIHLMLARCDRREDKPVEARKHYEDAIATKKAPAATSLELAATLRYDWKTAQSIADADAVMNRLVEERPQEIEARLARCRYRLAAGDRRGARDDVEHAFALPGGADNSDILLQLASIAAPDDPKFARNLLERALKSKPDDAVLTLGLAEMLVATNAEAEAKQLLHAAVKKLADTDPHLLDFGDRFVDLNEFDAALATADRLPSAGSASYLRGRVSVLRGNWPAAIPLLESSLSTVQWNANLHKKAYLALGLAHGAANDFPNQLKDYEAAWAIDRGSVAAQFGIAEALANLGQTAKAAERYRELAPKQPLARVRYAEIKFAEILAQPERNRNWDEFERILGPRPYPPDIAALEANVRYIQKKPAEAILSLRTVLAIDPDQRQLWLTLAMLRGFQDPAAGLKTLDEALAKFGDAVDLRLLRAQFLSREPKSILALAEKAEFPATERFRLFVGLAEMLLALDQRAEALSLLQKATAEMPFDLPTRLALFDLANGLQNAEVRDRALDEIRKLDGADGAVTIVSEVSRELLRQPKLDDAARIALESRLKIALGKRESWGRIHVLLGDLAFTDGRSDAALAEYRRGIDRGERGDALIRRVVHLLWEQQNFQEATQLLATMTATVALPGDLQRQHTLLRSAIHDDAVQSLKWVRSPELANSKNFRDHLTRGTVFFIHGATDESMTALQKAKSLNDSAPELWVAIVRFLAATGQQDAALQQANAAEKRLRQPDVIVANPALIPLAIGECREIVGDSAAAEVEFKKAWALRESDPAAAQRLHGLFQRTGQQKEAEDLLAKAIATGKTDSALWARRTKAVAVVSTADRFKNVPIALGWLDENLRDGNNSLADIRAKGFVMAIDPFQRRKGIELLTESSARAPLSPDQNFLLAKLHVAGGEAALAEKALVEATKAGPLAAPEHLALLADIQLDRNDLPAAKPTLNRLKLRAPNSWDTAVEEARYAAKDGRPQAGAKRILDFPLPGSELQKVTRRGQSLEEIGCFGEAEKLYADFAETEIPLVQFLIRRGRTPEAIDILNRIRATAPAESTARLFSSAVYSRMGQPLDAKLVADVEQWVAGKLKENPKSEDLLIASAELAEARQAYAEAIEYYTRGNRLDRAAFLTALHKKDGGPATLALINEAIRLGGPSPALLDTRAVVRMAAGEYREALRDLEAAAGADPRPVFQFHLALVYDKLGNGTARAASMVEAKKRGLKKSDLHPLEWSEYQMFSGAK